MTATKAGRIRFGDFAADLTTGELFRAGVKLPLQDKPFRILSFLIQHPNQLISRHEIICKLWPDTFVEGDLCLNVAMRRLRATLEDAASHSRFVETVGKYGYRFIARVRGSHPHEMPPSSRDRPRLAIFPLKQLMGSEPTCFCSTLTEVLIIQLRRLNPPFAVVTPEFTTERAPKGKATLALCRRAGADYALVGSVSEAGEKLRVTVRLLSCELQSCIWADSYIREANDLFAVQEEIARTVARTLRGNLYR